jgi:DNA-binding NarL/FixJ family response regulator
VASHTIGASPGCEHGAVSRSVLVVDDDAIFRRLISGILSGWGHTVVGEAADVEEALARAIELRPDIALVDVGLPDGDGFALTRQLCAIPSPPRVVLISTDADAASVPATRRAGASGFLAKDKLSGPALRRLIEDA